jgi:hypothetical protein
MFWKPNLSHIHGLGMALLTADAVDGSQAASTVCDDYPDIWKRALREDIEHRFGKVPDDLEPVGGTGW